MSDWILVALTAVYVIATIFISLSNSRSSKAIKEQISESQKQFIDENRAFVNIDFEIIRDDLYTLKVMNHGKRTASNVRVVIAEDFLGVLKSPHCKEHMELLNESAFSIGIGQSWYINIGSLKDYNSLKQKPITIDLSYSDCFSEYNEKRIIDLSQYGWGLVYDTPINDIRSSIEKISKDVHALSQK